MAYRLRFDQRFRRNLDALPGDIRSTARQVIAQLANNPRPSSAKELDEHLGYYRMWLPRDHRLVWNVLENEQIIDLLYIGHKTQDLYERLGLGRLSSRSNE